MKIFEYVVVSEKSCESVIAGPTVVMARDRDDVLIRAIASLSYDKQAEAKEGFVRVLVRKFVDLDQESKLRVNDVIDMGWKPTAPIICSSTVVSGTGEASDGGVTESGTIWAPGTTKI